MLSPNELAGLERIRRRRRLLFGVLAALPLALAIHSLSDGPLALRQAVLLGWVAAYGFATLSVVASRCPRCAGLFHDVRGFRNPLHCACRGCGLPLAPGTTSSPTSG